MKQIIRVEHTDGIGIFTERDSYDVYLVLPLLSDRHDNFHTPWEDHLKMTENHFCAYKSIEHIQEQIYSDEFKVLFEEGFSVYLIEVSAWEEGRDNVIFKKEDEISRKDISELFISSKMKQ